MVRTATERREQRRRSFLWVGLLSFLFHAVFPYYAVAADGNPDGYTTTICTAYGYKTVFVAFDDPQAQTETQPEADQSSYFECPTCIVQANASGWFDTSTPLFEALLPQAEGQWSSPRSLTPESQHYPAFLIRGPPA